MTAFIVPVVGWLFVVGLAGVLGAMGMPWWIPLLGFAALALWRGEL